MGMDPHWKPGFLLLIGPVERPASSVDSGNVDTTLLFHWQPVTWLHRDYDHEESHSKKARNAKAKTCLRIYLEFLSCWNKSQVGNHTVWCSRVTFGEPRERACDLLGPRPRKYFSDPKWCGRITLMHRAKLGEGPGWVYGPLYTLHTFTVSTVSTGQEHGFCERTSQRPVDQNISCTLTCPKCCWEFLKVAKPFRIITGRLFA